jgi:soluble lytic murein transglycosylase-like protein
MLLLSSLFAWDCSRELRAESGELKTINRCLKYQALVIRESRYHIGMDAPAHLFMGQIEQESRCDEGITAFDGGMGLGQFMPDTAEWIQEKEKALKEISVEPSPYDPRWSIRALILYDRWLYGVVICKGWYFAFRGYNGGAGRLNKEIKAADSCEIYLVERACKRKVIKLKSGKSLDMCKVNIEYSPLIYQKAEKYDREGVMR